MSLSDMAGTILRDLPAGPIDRTHSAPPAQACEPETLNSGVFWPPYFASFVRIPGRRKPITVMEEDCEILHNLGWRRQPLLPQKGGVAMRVVPGSITGWRRQVNRILGPI